jgi:hypothetical protein
VNRCFVFNSPNPTYILPGYAWRCKVGAAISFFKAARFDQISANQQAAFSKTILLCHFSATQE